MRAEPQRVIGLAISPRNTCASTRVTEHRLSFPLPARKLFAERDFLELANACSRNRFHEHESIWHLPTGKRLPEKLAQFVFGCGGAISQNHGRKRPLLPLRMRQTDH